MQMTQAQRRALRTINEHSTGRGKRGYDPASKEVFIDTLRSLVERGLVQPLLRSNGRTTFTRFVPTREGRSILA